METKTLSRAYLETLSTDDLISIADEYGIDIPDDLNRRFIIGELLEVAEEMNRAESDTASMHIAETTVEEAELPETFNETQIDMVMRNPVWAFVYWDIKESDRARIAAADDFVSLLLRVSFFSDMDADSAPETFFDVQVSTTERGQYVLFPAGKKIVRIDLVMQFRNKGVEVIAHTERQPLPHGSPLLSAIQPGQSLNCDAIAELSALPELLKEHYENHRQSFLS